MEQTQERSFQTTEELEDFETVRTWFAGWEEQWGSPLSAQERTDKLRPLLRLSQGVEKNPDEMIRQCTLVKDGVRKISIKGRRFYWEQIRTVEEEGDRKSANYLRSFFIHNGIMMQAETERYGADR